MHRNQLTHGTHLAHVACASRVLMLVLLCAGQAWAQGYPSKPIRAVNPWPPGSGSEHISRVILQKLSESLKQPIVLDSRPGANGMIGTDFVAKSAPDGYTLLVSHVGPTAISPAMQPMPYDSVKDLAPITQLVSGPLILLVTSDSPFRTMRDIVTHARAHPGALSYGSVGPGSTTHLAGAMLGLAEKVDLLHVPYKGGSPVMVDLLGKRISMAFISGAGAKPQIESGKLRPIAVTTQRRSALFPEVPAIADSIAEFEVNSWYGLMAPGGTPRDILDRLNAETVKVLAAPDVVQSLRAAGLDIEGSSREQFAERIRKDLARWSSFVKATGITAN